MTRIQPTTIANVFSAEAERKRSRLAATAAGQAAMFSRAPDDPSGPDSS